jgi:hypothetical protein
MPTDAEDRDHWNAARWPTGRGHYESWFVRANHPNRPLALWVRYTIFAPSVAPEAAEGELWAVWFDGERNVVTAAKAEYPTTESRFDREGLGVAIAGSTLDDRGLTGECARAGHALRWSLTLAAGDRPLLLQPPGSYARGFPKAKVVASRPGCLVSGEVWVDGERMTIDGWPGSQNHNWGPAHTDRYAWGQVVGFDGHENAILECASARIRVGPVLVPWLTTAVLRLGGEEHAFNAFVRAPLARARVGPARWSFRTSNGRDRLRVSFRSDPTQVATLAYRDPPGGTKVCLNTKIATCDLELTRGSGERVIMRSAFRAAFEVLGLTTPVGGSV